MRRLPLVVLLLSIAACASSSGGPADGGDDQPIDAPAAVDAAAPDAVPDAEPCVPSPDGEICNGADDDCDDATDEGFAGVGEPCEVGTGACLVAGTTVCTEDGTSTECGADPLPPGDELCGNGIDDDCDSATDEGFPDLGTPCSVGTGACFATGVYVCSQSGLATVCNASPGDPQVETCNGADEDCDTFVDEDFQINQPCDGADSDLCGEGVWVCDGAGGRTCTDSTGSSVDLCGGGDDDCDPASADGSEDPQVGQGCDGASDTDLCIEGVTLCVGGGLTCTDATGSTTDNCGGGDDDCDASSPDGSEHPGLAAPCDGGDSDLCVEGTMQCSGTTLACNDSTGSTLDLCGNGNEDCDAASADGSEDALVGIACDGPGDTDLCLESTSVCSGGAITCPDNTTSTPELCNGAGADEDCQGGVDEDWNRDDNPSCTGALFNLGSMSGDTGSGYLSDSWYDEEWDSFTLTEDNDLDIYLSATVRLYSPPGVDYDLYLRCASCGGAIVQSSTTSGLGGHYDYLYPRWGDDWGAGDDLTLIVEVRHKQSNVCAYWTLEAWGNTNLDGYADTCDP